MYEVPGIIIFSLNKYLKIILHNYVYIPNVEKSFNTGAGKYSLLISL